MKLQLDENLSRRIVPFLQADCPGSTQVALLDMERANGRTVWEYTKENGFTIVSRDSDFYELSMIYGSPPKVVWLRQGNQGKAETVAVLLNHRAAIKATLTDGDNTFLEIY